MTEEDIETLDSVIDDFKQEIEFYKNLSNEDWSDDKNEGFREGLKYSMQRVEIIKSVYLDELGE